MKNVSTLLKVFLLLLFTSLSHFSFGQGWFNAGFKFGYGTGFIGSSSFLNDNKFNNVFSFSSDMGLKFGYYINNSHEIGLEGLTSPMKYKFTHAQRNEATGLTPGYNSSIAFSAKRIMIIYRRHQEGSYVEAGFFGTGINKIKIEDEYSLRPKAYFDETNLNQFGYGLVTGFGSHVIAEKNISLLLGLRVSYQISDLVSSTGHAIGFPKADGKPLNAVTIQLSTELNFDLFYRAFASCGRAKYIRF